MATGREISSSFYRSSDVIYDFSCTPCSESEKNTEAVNYCVKCDTYFCETCIGLHDTLLKSHIVLDKAAMRARSSEERSKTQSKTTAILQKNECVDHPGNVIQMYCGDHDLVCCTVCVAVDHRTCKSVDFIPKVAKTKVTDKNRRETETALETDLKELEQLRSKKSEELLDVGNTQDSILKEIQKFKDRILARVKQLEKKSAEDVREQCKGPADQIKSEIKQLERLLRSTKEQMGKINNLKEMDETQKFVIIKLGQHVIAENKDTKLKLKHCCSRTFSFDFASPLKSLLWELDTFGSMVDGSGRLNSIALSGEYDCKSKDDEKNCLSFGTCVLENGHILMTDINNYKLKRLDHTYKVIDSCFIDAPYAVCKTRVDEVAVSSLDTGKICFVSIRKDLSPTRTISVGKNCMGIVYSNDELFVACGQYGGVNNSLKVYDLNDVVLRTIPLTASLAHMSIGDDRTRLFCADIGKGLFIVDKQGKEISSLSDSRLQSAYGVCHGLYGNVFVCSEIGNRLFQIDRKGSVIGELLTRTDGLDQPVSVTYAQKPDRLLITSQTKPLQVYQLDI